MNSMHEVYKSLLHKCMKGYAEVNARTKTRVMIADGPQSFSVHMGGGLPVPGNRKYWPHIAAAETAWQFMGTRDPSFILKHAPKLWSKFVEQEPGPENHDHLGPSGGQSTIDVLKTAYGFRWRKAFGRDQVQLALDALKADSTNRQVYLQAWDPRSDGLGQPDQPKNIPCPIGFSLNIVNNRLNCAVFIRSSDVFVGLPYDVMGYALTADAFASSLGIEPGVLHVTLAHAHIYEPHFKAVEACTTGEHKSWNNPRVPLPAWPIEMIEANPDAYITQLKLQSKRADFPAWDPQPIVVE